MNKFFIILIIILFSSINSYSKNISFSGLNKLSVNDLQSLTSIDLNEKNISKDQLNILINELYESDLIYDVKLKIEEKKYLLFIEENKIINDIYFNNNTWVDDTILKDSIISKNNSLLLRDNIQLDIKELIRYINLRVLIKFLPLLNLSHFQMTE